MKTLIYFQNFSKILILSLAVILTSCEKEPVSQELNALDANVKASPAAQKGDLTIAEIVVASTQNDNQFNLLLAALEYTGLTSTFTGGDNYTVFAPTDEAFLEFLGGDARNLYELPVDAVKDVLLYHVTDGRRFSNSVVPKNNPKEIETLLGPSIYVHPADEEGNIYIDTNDEDMDENAMIVKADISASNGVIHVIDAVLAPAEE